MDLLTGAVVILLFDILRFHTLPPENIGYHSLSGFLGSRVLIWEQILLPVMLVTVYAISGYYNSPFQRSRIQEFINTALSEVANTLLIYFALLTNGATAVRATNYELLLSLFILLVGITYLGRWIITVYTSRQFRSGRSKYTVMIAGTPESVGPLAERVRANAPRTGLHLGGYVTVTDSKHGFPDDLPVYTPEELYSDVRTIPLQEVMLTTAGSTEKEILRLIHRLFPIEVPVKITPESVSALNSNIRLQSIYEEPYIDASSANVSEYTKNLKRLCDVGISALALTLLAIPMGVIALMVKRDSSGPVFFRQERIGYRRKPFRIIKFRTMRTDAEARGPQLSSEDDPRVTRLGATLRKYRLDELPQFWNVLKGDMSLVGPRPERQYFIDQIMERDPSYALVHQVRPGITSWGMVKYGYASHVDQMVRRLRYDLIYISNMSIASDIKILIYTLKTVLKGRGM